MELPLRFFFPRISGEPLLVLAGFASDAVVG